DGVVVTDAEPGFHAPGSLAWARRQRLRRVRPRSIGPIRQDRRNDREGGEPARHAEQNVGPSLLPEPLLVLRAALTEPFAFFFHGVGPGVVLCIEATPDRDGAADGSQRGAHPEHGGRPAAGIAF